MFIHNNQTMNLVGLSDNKWCHGMDKFWWSLNYYTALRPQTNSNQFSSSSHKNIHYVPLQWQFSWQWCAGTQRGDRCGLLQNPAVGSSQNISNYKQILVGACKIIIKPPLCASVPLWGWRQDFRKFSQLPNSVRVEDSVTIIVLWSWHLPQTF